MHYVDAYGDLIAGEWFETESGLVDAYGDPAPVDRWERACEPREGGACVVCGSQA